MEADKLEQNVLLKNEKRCSIAYGLKKERTKKKGDVELKLKISLVFVLFF